MLIPNLSPIIRSTSIICLYLSTYGSTLNSGKCTLDWYRVTTFVKRAGETVSLFLPQPTTHVSCWLPENGRWDLCLWLSFSINKLCSCPYRQHRPSWRTESNSVDKVVTPLAWNQKFHSRVQKNPSIEFTREPHESSTYTQATTERPILIWKVSFQLACFFRDFLNFCGIPNSPLRATWPAHLSLFGFIVMIISRED